ncbi:hypothetical protein [Candidatus Lokiarchaeum ossiferum]|uniref:hypothetical protein n=1 Tax=Candidatus Lokiarchaeum ossiferum TaxID=2951803 RepID=UPI00352BEAC8
METDVGEMKETIKETDQKVDVIVSTTDAIATNVGKLNSERSTKKENEEGTIQRGDWKGTAAAIVSFVITAALTAWQLFSVMYGESNPFIASLSVMMTPAIWVLIETLSGKNIKKNDVMHQLELKNKERLHKVETDKLKGVNQMQMIEVYNMKEKIARLEERGKTGVIKKAEPSLPKNPPL